MKLLPYFIALFATGNGMLLADDAPIKPVLKISPGQVIVPTDAMRRIWGELVSVDLTTRTGTFRNEGTDEIMSFNVLPYAELLHHATFGDLGDFRLGERVIFRMHESASGQWTWLTYIQDEMNMMNGHKEFFHVESIDADKGQLICSQANVDQTYVRERGIPIETTSETRFWKAGSPATFSDIKIGDKLRTKTHGVGKGKVRMCWEVFLDEESLLQFQSEQKSVHAERIKKEGAPGYVDQLTGRELHLTLFQEGSEMFRTLKFGQKILVAPAGLDRKPTSAPAAGTIIELKAAGNLRKVTVTLEESPTVFPVGEVARLWN